MPEVDVYSKSLKIGCWSEVLGYVNGWQGEEKEDWITE